MVSAPTAVGEPLRRVVAAIVVAVLSGALMAVQARINGELGLRMGSGAAAAAVSFGSGLVLVSAVVLLVPAARRGVPALLQAARTRTLPWWSFLGGLGGALLVVSQGVASAVLGVALFSAAVIAGQMLSGLVVDRLGISPGGRRAVTARRAAAAIVAVAVLAVPVFGGTASVPVLALLLPVLAGAAVAWQQAVNGRAAAAAGSSLTATLLNFVVGFTVLVPAAAVFALVQQRLPAVPAEPWVYSGGAVGALFIFGFVVAVRVLGVLLMGLASIGGQLLTGLLLDVVGRVEGVDVPRTALAAGVVLACALLAALPSRRGLTTD
ncbi:MAG TPA: DMT family transporter [Naasia sp.]|jgi:transporter family-2 protein